MRSVQHHTTPKYILFITVISYFPNSAEAISFISTIFLMSFGERERTKHYLSNSHYLPSPSSLCFHSNLETRNLILTYSHWKCNCLEDKCQTSWRHIHCLHLIYLCNVISQHLFQNITMLPTWDFLNRGKNLIFDVSSLCSIQWTCHL